MRKRKSVWRQVWDASSWLNNLEDPTLSPDERLVLRLVCSELGTLLGSRGFLFLTSRRLVFRQRKFSRFGARNLEIMLSDIKAIESVGWFRSLRPGLPGFPKIRVQLSSGKPYVFGTLFAHYVSGEIRRTMQGATNGTTTYAQA